MSWFTWNWTRSGHGPGVAQGRRHTGWVLVKYLPEDKKLVQMYKKHKKIERAYFLPQKNIAQKIRKTLRLEWNAWKLCKTPKLRIQTSSWPMVSKGLGEMAQMCSPCSPLELIFCKIHVCKKLCHQNLELFLPGTARGKGSSYWHTGKNKLRFL